MSESANTQAVAAAYAEILAGPRGSAGIREMLTLAVGEWNDPEADMPAICDVLDTVTSILSEVELPAHVTFQEHFEGLELALNQTTSTTEQAR